MWYLVFVAVAVGLALRWTLVRAICLGIAAFDLGLAVHDGRARIVDGLDVLGAGSLAALVALLAPWSRRELAPAGAAIAAGAVAWPPLLWSLRLAAFRGSMLWPAVAIVGLFLALAAVPWRPRIAAGVFVLTSAAALLVATEPPGARVAAAALLVAAAFATRA